MKLTRNALDGNQRLPLGIRTPRLVVVVAALLMVALGLLTLAGQSFALGTFRPLDQKMNDGRFEPMTVTLPDGRVLIAGGLSSEIKGSPHYSNEVDLFDPQSGELSRVGSLQAARARTTPILMPDGRVLFVGGVWLDKWSSEIFDPDTGSSETFDLPPGLPALVAVAALPGGKALLASGTGDLRSAAVLDLTTHQVSPVEGTPGPLHDSSRPLTLPNGRILIFGGRNSRRDVINRGVVFDPVEESFTPVPGPRIPRIGPEFTVLNDGRVLISDGARKTRDGKDFKYLKSAEVYSPASGTSSLTGPPVSRRQNGEAVKLNDGRILITGGTGPVRTGSKRSESVLRSAEIYNPETGRFTSTGELYRLRAKAGLVALPGGSALVAGGISIYDYESALASAELFEPQGETAMVKRIIVTPKVRKVKIGKRFRFKVRMTNSGKGVARRVKVCMRFRDWRFRPFRCTIVKDVAPGETRQTVAKGVIFRIETGSGWRPVVHGQTERFEIYAIGQDVNVYSTGRVKAR